MIPGQRVKIKDYPRGLLSHGVADGKPLRKYYGLTDVMEKIEGTVIQIPANSREYWGRNAQTEVVKLDSVSSFECRVEWDNGFRNSFKFRDLKPIKK